MISYYFCPVILRKLRYNWALRFQNIPEFDGDGVEHDECLVYFCVLSCTEYCSGKYFKVEHDSRYDDDGLKWLPPGRSCGMRQGHPGNLEVYGNVCIHNEGIAIVQNVHTCVLDFRTKDTYRHCSYGRRSRLTACYYIHTIPQSHKYIRQIAPIQISKHKLKKKTELIPFYATPYILRFQNYIIYHVDSGEKINNVSWGYYIQRNILHSVGVISREDPVDAFMV